MQQLSDKNLQGKDRKLSWRVSVYDSLLPAWLCLPVQGYLVLMCFFIVHPEGS